MGGPSPACWTECVSEADDLAIDRRRLMGSAPRVVRRRARFLVSAGSITMRVTLGHGRQRARYAPSAGLLAIAIGESRAAESFSLAKSASTGSARRRSRTAGAPIPSAIPHRGRTGTPVPRVSDDDQTQRPRSFGPIHPAFWLVFFIAAPSVKANYARFSLRLRTFTNRRRSRLTQVQICSQVASEQRSKFASMGTEDGYIDRSAWVQKQRVSAVFSTLGPLS